MDIVHFLKPYFFGFWMCQLLVHGIWLFVRMLTDRPYPKSYEYPDRWGYGRAVGQDMRKSFTWGVGLFVVFLVLDHLF